MQKVTTIFKAKCKIGIVAVGFCFCIVVTYAIVSIRFSSNFVPYNVNVLVKYFQTSGDKAFHAPGGWIFYSHDIGIIVNQWRHTRHNEQVICSLNDTLSKLGVQLIVVPVPDKETIIQTYSLFNVEVASNQRKQFLTRLEKRKVAVIDLTPAFFANRLRDQLYVKRDTHWDQEGIRLGAKEVASRISMAVSGRPQEEYLLKDTLISGPCDLSMMLHDSTSYSRKCTIILCRDGSVLNDAPSSDIMIFGDSFANVNWKQGAGIGAYITYFTKMPTFTYTTLRGNNQGPRLLLKYLQTHKKPPRVVVWIFASRFLFDGIEPY